jgi:hypothetical protein
VRSFSGFRVQKDCKNAKMVKKVAQKLTKKFIGKSSVFRFESAPC